jgi:hypothetical protein
VAHYCSQVAPGRGSACGNFRGVEVQEGDAGGLEPEQSFPTIVNSRRVRIFGCKSCLLLTICLLISRENERMGESYL